MAKTLWSEGYNNGREQAERQLDRFESREDIGTSYKHGWNKAVYDVLCERLNIPKHNVYKARSLWEQIRSAAEEKVLSVLERIFPK